MDSVDKTKQYYMNYRLFNSGGYRAFSFVNSLNYYYKDTEPYKPAILLEDSEEFISGCIKLVKFCNGGL